MSKISAGILVYRRKNNQENNIEVLLAHPGGPLWSKKDLGFWGIPKGEIKDNEDLLEAAKREFQEETNLNIENHFFPLGSVTQKSGKVVHAWATERDLDLSAFKSNTFLLEWPPKSGSQKEFPEIDKIEYFDIETARQKMNPAQAEFLNKIKDIASP